MAFFPWNKNHYQRNDKIRSIPTSVNVGTLIFGLILVYIIITLILYLTQKHIAGYAIPKEIEFKDSLPKTLVGKVAFRQLEEEANAEAGN